jgi:hypothetical protein
MAMKLTRKALAAELGISGAMVTKLAARGMPTDSVPAARAWRAAVVRPRISDQRDAATPRDEVPLAGTLDVDAGEDYRGARLRREIAEADLAEMRRAREAGTLVPAESVRAALARRLVAMRERLLTMNARLGPVLAAEAEPQRVALLLDDEVHAALQDLAQFEPATSDHGEPQHG